MKELIVVTYKLPADELARKMYGDNTEYIYDSVAFHNDQFAELEIKKLRRKYTEVDSFVCNFAAYYDWVDNEAAYEEFVRTGVCPIKPIEEDVEVGTDSKTITIECNVRIQREDSTASFDYKVDIDNVGQIVFTPHDVGTRFCPDGEDVTPGENTKFETVTLTAQMLSDSGNYDYFTGIDEVGQFVITPDTEDTSFLSVSVNDSLNLVTESADPIVVDTNHVDPFQIGDRVVVHINGNGRSGEIVDYVDQDPMDSTTGVDSGRFEAWVVRFDDGTQEMIGTDYITLENVYEEYEAKNMKFMKESRDFEWNREELYAVIKEDGTYAGVPCLSYEEALDLSYHPGSKIFKLVLVPGQEDETELEEEVTTVNHNDIVNKVMNGEIDVYSEDGKPNPSFVHIEELDNVQGNIRYEYYYDEESDSVASYIVELED